MKYKKRLFLNLAVSSLNIALFINCFFESGFIPFSIISIASPLLFLTQILFWLFWRLKHKEYCLVPILTLCMVFPHLLTTFNLAFLNSRHPNDIKVISYNVRSFNSYGSGGWDTDENSKQIYNWIKKSDADILFLQEYYDDDDSPYFNSHDQLIAEGYKYSYESFHYTNIVGGEYGGATFSKYPILNSEVIFKEEGLGKGGNRIIYSDILIKSDTIRVINCHLSSYKLTKNQDIRDGDFDDRKTKFKRLYERLTLGISQREHQIQKLKGLIEKTSFPVILAGDFNDTPYSQAYHVIQSYLEDSFLDQGFGFGFSLNKKSLPFIRIDFQFHSKNIECTSFKTMKRINHSDHYPTFATYKIN